MATRIAKPDAAIYPRITAPFPTQAPVVRGRPVKSMTLLAKVEDRVADMTMASTPAQMRKLAARVYRAIEDFRTQNIEERIWTRRRAAADDGLDESVEA